MPVNYLRKICPPNIGQWLKTKNRYGINNETFYLFGPLVLAAVITIIFVAIFYNPDKFTDTTLSRNQPVIFKKQIKTGPGNCLPYSGCFYPSFMSNPISLKTGTRLNEPNENKIWCQEAWRDCNAYQSCINGKCIPKHQ